MAVQLPPFPVNSPPGSWMWVDWWKKLQDYIAEVTKVVAQKTIPNANVTGMPGFLTLPVSWVVLGNYCQFDIDIPITGFPFATTDSTILLASASPELNPPLPIQDGLCYWCAYGGAGSPGTPSVQSLGVGYIKKIGGVATMFLPNVTVNGYTQIHITGRYNLS